MIYSTVRKGSTISYSLSLKDSIEIGPLNQVIMQQDDRNSASTAM